MPSNPSFHDISKPSFSKRFRFSIRSLFQFVLTLANSSALSSGCALPATFLSHNHDHFRSLAPLSSTRSLPSSSSSLPVSSHPTLSRHCAKDNPCLSLSHCVLPPFYPLVPHLPSSRRSRPLRQSMTFTLLPTRYHPCPLYTKVWLSLASHCDRYPFISCLLPSLITLMTHLIASVSISQCKSHILLSSPRNTSPCLFPPPPPPLRRRILHLTIFDHAYTKAPLSILLCYYYPIFAALYPYLPSILSSLLRL